MSGAVDTYETAVVMSGATAPTYTVSALDKRRIQAYWTYENLFRNTITAYKAVLRDIAGDEKSIRLIPSARTIVEATNRYLCLDPTIVTPAADRIAAGVTPPTPELVANCLATLNGFFDRERVVEKLLSMKRWMLIHGDRVMHLTADATKDEGTRISLHELPADTYFPIHNEVDSSRVDGCYLVNIITVGDSEVAQRLEYRKIRTPEDQAAFGGSPIGSVWARMTFWEPDGWDDRAEYGLSSQDLKPAAEQPAWAGTPSAAALIAGFTLPATITSIPVYHFKNGGEGAFGVSEIQGIETLIAGISQTATDEDLTVVLQGVGVYWTTSGRPRDATGKETDWVISPASILELEKDTAAGRLEGATDINSLLQHRDMMEKAAMEGTGTPDVAVGTIAGNAASAESGVALAIRFAPIVAKNQEKELGIAGTFNQLLFDLIGGWYPTYEGMSWPGVVVQIQFSNPVPIDRTATLDEIIQMLTNKIISLEVARQLISDRLGYQFPTDMGTQVLNEQTALLDQTAGRLDAAINDPNAGAAV